MTIALGSYGNDDFQAEVFGGISEENQQDVHNDAFADDKRQKRKMGFVSSSPFILTMTGFMVKARCFISKLITKCVIGLRETQVELSSNTKKEAPI